MTSPSSRHHCALALCTLATSASAAIHVEYRASPTGGGSFTAPPAGTVTIAGANILITHAADSAWRVRTDNPASESIGSIIFNTGAATPIITLLVASSGSTSIDPDLPLPGPGCLDWAGLIPGNAVVTVQARIARDLTGPITAERLVRLDALRDIAADITHESTTELLSAVTAAAVTPGSRIQSAGGRIALVRADSHMRGDVVNTAGSIGTIESTLGVIGTSAGPFSLISASGTIDSIRADGHIAGVGLVGGIYADITAGAGIREIRSSTVFNGSLTTPTLLPRTESLGGIIRVEHAYLATTVFNDGIPADAQIIIGAALGETGGSQTFDIGDGTAPDSGLAGQIMIGAFVAEGTWLTPIKVHRESQTYELGAEGNEYYTALPSDLGGGAAGVVGFGLHRRACIPPADEAYFGEVLTTINSIYIEHYAPVTFANSPVGYPLIVKSKVRNAPDEELRDITDCCATSIVVGSPRTLKIGFYGRLLNGYEYVITPAASGTDMLRGLVEGDPAAPVAAYEYRLPVGNECPTDFNGDGLTNAGDLSVLLFAFGIGEEELIGQPGCIVVGDVNNNGTVNGADLSVFLGQFGTECSGSESPGFSAASFASALGPGLLATLGFESEAAYLEWFNALSPPQQLEHLESLQSYTQE